MFAKTIVTSDAFLDMPLSARCLYFTLGMFADDDGFVNNPKSIMRQVGASTDDLNLLLLKRFILTFESGVVVIKHWRIHNYIQKDRYKETKYLDEKSSLSVDENGAYTECIQDVYISDTQVRLGKDRIVEDSIEECISAEPTRAPKPTKRKFGEYSHVLLTEDQRAKLIDEYGEDLTAKAITFLDEYIEMKGYKAKNHYLAIKKWVIDAVKERLPKGQAQGSFDTDDFFESAISKTFAKTAGEDEEIRKRAEALKQKLS
jgi:hypothetical protein